MIISEIQLRSMIRNLLLEGSLNEDRLEFEKLVQSGQITEDEYNKKIFKGDSTRREFSDSIMRTMTLNTFKKDQGHNIGDIVNRYEEFANKILSPYHSGDMPRSALPGGIELRELIEKGEATYDDFSLYIEEKEHKRHSTSSKHQDQLQESLDSVLEKLVDKKVTSRIEGTDFDVIYKDSKWLVCYPKTYKGSIALAKMAPELESGILRRFRYYSFVGTHPIVGWMPWCTAAAGAGNQFLNYHIHMCLHMYYCIKIPDYSTEDKYRKLCVSLIKRQHRDYSTNELYESVELYTKQNSTVNANNKKLTLEEIENNTLGKEIYDLLKADASGDHRSVHDEKARQRYLESINLDQFNDMRKAASAGSPGDIEWFEKNILFGLRSGSKDRDIQHICRDLMKTKDDLVKLERKVRKLTGDMSRNENYTITYHLPGSDESYNLYAGLFNKKANILDVESMKSFISSIETLILMLESASSVAEELDILANSIIADHLFDLEIKISTGRVKNLPESIGNFKNMRTLQLRDIEPSELPEEELDPIISPISKIQNLTKLNLGFNQLKTLPESIGNLTNITTLDLTCNELISLPESIGNLTNLTTLDLSSNELISLPESIGNLTNLTKLDIRGNQLTSLPETIVNLKNLNHLYLGGNLFEDYEGLPESIKKFGGW